MLQISNIWQYFTHTERRIRAEVCEIFQELARQYDDICLWSGMGIKLKAHAMAVE